jgi:hypothetical protein
MRAPQLIDDRERRKKTSLSAHTLAKKTLMLGKMRINSLFCEQTRERERERELFSYGGGELSGDRSMRTSFCLFVGAISNRRRKSINTSGSKNKWTPPRYCTIWSSRLSFCEEEKMRATVLGAFTTRMSMRLSVLLFCGCC